MKRLLLGSVVVAMLAAACGGGGRSTSGTDGTQNTDPIKIGVVGPMTGLAGFVGKNMIEGIQLAVDDVNQAGGLLGREVEFVTRDDEFDPSKTATAVRELFEKEGVQALFGPAGTSNYLSVSRLIQDANIPTWAITAAPELSGGVNPAAFRAYLPDGAQISSLAQFAAKRYAKIGVIASNDGDGQAFRDAMKEALAKYGKTPVASEAFAADETDFSPIVLKVKQSGANAVVVGNHLGLYVARVASAMKNLGYKAQILGVAGIISYTYPDLARDAANGTIFVSFRSWVDKPANEWPTSVRTFYDRYVKKYLPDGEFSQTGAYKAFSTNFLTYDMVKIWAYAVQKARSAEPDDVVKVLNGDFTYPAENSVIGVPWHYTATDHNGIQEGDLFFYRWELGANGKYTLRIAGTTADVLAGKVAL